jgi:hypothetical protein
LLQVLFGQVTVQTPWQVSRLPTSATQEAPPQVEGHVVSLQTVPLSAVHGDVPGVVPPTPEQVPPWQTFVGQSTSQVPVQEPTPTLQAAPAVVQEGQLGVPQGSPSVSRTQPVVSISTTPVPALQIDDRQVGVEQTRLRVPESSQLVV